MTNDLKSALTIVYGDIVAINEKADTNATNIESNTSNIETLQREVATNTTQLSTNTSNIETLQQEVANLKASASGVLYNESVESGVGYELSVSENALPYGTIDIVGGMSYKKTNIIDSVISDTTNNGITYNSNGGITNLSNTATANSNNLIYTTTLKAGTYYFKSFGETGATDTYLSYIQKIVDDNPTVLAYSYTNGSFTLTEDTLIEYRFIVRNGVNATDIQFKDMVVSGSTAPTEFKQGFEGIRNTIITSVVSKDSNDNLLATGEIPQEIQALNGYGWGISQSVCNYIDFENKKFVQKVGRVKISDIETINYNSTYQVFYFYITTKKQGSVLMANFTTVDTAYQQMNNMEISGASSANGINAKDTSCVDVNAFRTKYNNYYLYYELTTPIETDISSYITDNTMQFGASGTITLNNDYEQAVPYQYTILEKVSE